MKQETGHRESRSTSMQVHPARAAASHDMSRAFLSSLSSAISMTVSYIAASDRGQLRGRRTRPPIPTPLYKTHAQANHLFYCSTLPSAPACSIVSLRFSAQESSPYTRASRPSRSLCPCGRAHTSQVLLARGAAPSERTERPTSYLRGRCHRRRRRW